MEKWSDLFKIGVLREENRLFLQERKRSLPCGTLMVITMYDYACTLEPSQEWLQRKICDRNLYEPAVRQGTGLAAKKKVIWILRGYGVVDDGFLFEKICT